MSDEEKSGAEIGPAEQEIVVRVEDMVWEKPSFVDTQQKIDLTGRLLDILKLHSVEERSDSGQVDWGKISCYVSYTEGEDVLDLQLGLHRVTL